MFRKILEKSNKLFSRSLSRVYQEQENSLWKILLCKKMKNLIYILFLLAFVEVKSQKIHTVQYSNQADVKVFVVDYPNQADLLVYKVKYSNQAGNNDGKWFFTEYSNQADKKIYFTDYANQAELKIYFVEYPNQAGWRDTSKKHLLY